MSVCGVGGEFFDHRTGRGDQIITDISGGGGGGGVSYVFVLFWSRNICMTPNINYVLYIFSLV